MKHSDLLTREFLLYHYVKKRKSYRKIAEEYNIPSGYTVLYYLKKFRISRPHVRKHSILTKELLIELYIDKNMPLRKIADYCNIKTSQFVRKMLDVYEIPVRKMTTNTQAKLDYYKRIRKGYEELDGVYWNVIKYGAKDRNLELNITPKDAWELFLKQDRKCALSGIKLFFKNYGENKEQTASLDRIDSKKGYTIDNIQWVHKNINAMKQDLDQDVFLNMCDAITKHRQERDIS